MTESIDKLIIEALSSETNEAIMESDSVGFIKVVISDFDKSLGISVEIEHFIPDILTTKLGILSKVVNNLYTINYKYKVFELIHERYTDSITEILIESYPNVRIRLIEYLKLLIN